MALLPAVRHEARAATTGRPNILFILLDDARTDGVMDEPSVLPKTKRWLAQGGAVFPQGYATSPLCCPERGTIWSGRLEHNTKVVDNASGDNLDRDWISSRYLHDAGYRTALVGKFITDWNFRYQPPHFDQFAALQGGYNNSPFMVKDPGQAKSKIISNTGYSTDFVGSKAASYIDGFAKDHPGQPWFMQVAPHAPHIDHVGDANQHAPGCAPGSTPAQQDAYLHQVYSWPSRYDNVPLPPYKPSPAVTVEGDSKTKAKADKDPYVRNNTFPSSCGKITWEGQMRTLMAADDMVDKVMTELQKTGQLSNTLVILTSDNGFSFGDRGVTSKGLPYREDILVPTMVRWDGHFPAGTVDQRPIGGEDYLPTFLDAAGYKPPVLRYPLDGRSFLPGRPGRSEKYLEFGPVGRPTPAGYQGHRGIPAWASIRTKDYQYIEWYGTGSTTPGADNSTVTFREYYDLHRDPWELQSLITTSAAAAANHVDVAALSARLSRLIHCVGTTGPDPCP
ncbi:MAG TPA: sulfatase-like hydrolase/transferase [Acidimicrobiia bacterium]